MIKTNFKPKGYNSVSPYFIVDGADRFMDLMKQIFDAKELRVYRMPDGSIMHAEMIIDDSVIMLGNASEKYPPIKIVMHVYVPKVDETFQKAIEAGCEVVEAPKDQEGDPDRRATFKDFAGNMWSVGTQLAGFHSISLLNKIKAPASKVYQTLIIEKGLSEIWTKNLKVKPELNFINEFDFGESYLTKMKITGLEKNQKISWLCIESDEEWTGTTVTFLISNEPDFTEIRLEHAGWREKTDYYKWCNYHWAMFLYRLKNYCEQ
ncbi:SRPBCC domain-containing protein [Cyclobacterium plantarum]|uniref:SRPBCC domain-containing protein n=1 Tax=Cyclobacterium plantarum TaxID=2716263 RepID=UPI003F6EEABA